MAPTPLEPPTKVFVDSSVLIAAAISPTGSARALILRGIEGSLSLFLSALVLDETQRNLAKKAPAALPAFAVFREALVAQLAEPPRELVLAVSQRIELKDAPIVAAALHAHVDYLATFDRAHLLDLHELIRAAYGLSVVTPDQLMAAQF
jgi:predicted nucleic acid-binding protein